MDTIFETLQHLSNTYSLLAVFVVTSLIATHLYIENSRQVRIANKLPGPVSLPLIGNAYLGIGQDPHFMYDLAMKFHKQYGSVTRAYGGTKVLIFLTHPQDIELILGSSVHLDKSVEYRFFQPWLGDGLLITSGKKWYRHRKVIAPTFHISVLKSFVPLFYENSIELVRRLCDKIGKDFDCHDYLSAVTVDILTETVMGVKREKRPKSGYDYAMAVMKLSDIIHRRHYDMWCLVAFKLTKYYRLQKKLLKIVHAVTNTVIKVKSEDVEKKLETGQKENQQNEKPTKNVKSDTSNYTKLHYVKDDLDDIDENDVGDKKRLAFLETLITMKQQGGQMTDEEIWEEVNTIMFEGHDTTAAGSSFVLCVLGCLPDIQARVHQELDAIFGDSDRQCTFSDTMEMKYLERVILETLRLFPPVPIIARRLNEDVKLVTNNYVIPKDVTIVIAQVATHRLEEFYPNPENFNPDNFLPERMQKRPYYSYIPFSAGPRSCVGRKYAMLKLKVLLSTILRNYRIISDEHYKDFKLRADIILKKDNGFMIRIEPRKSAQRLLNQTRLRFL